MEPVEQLVRLIVETFYEEKHLVLIDYVLHRLSDETLADRLHVTLRDLSKATARLREDQFLSVYTRTIATIQPNPSSSSPAPAMLFYYLDYGHFVNVTKWKLLQMGQALKREAVDESSQMCYKCPHSQCGRSYSLIDVHELFDPTSDSFKCKVCHSELKEAAPSQSSTSTSSSKHQLLALFNDQTGPIWALLRQIDKLTIPAFDPAANLRKLLKEEEPKEFQEAAKKKAAQEELEVEILAPVSSYEKIQAHELPSWHTHSTITGNIVQPTAPVFAPKVQKEIGVESIQEEDEEDVDVIVDEPVVPECKTSPFVSQAMIMVQGRPKLLADVTEEDKSLMTEDEYIIYYEAYQSQHL